MLLKEYAYCPRYAYYRLFLEKDYTTESMWEAHRFTADELHEIVRLRAKKVYTEVPVKSLKLGLRGVVDMVVLDDDGAAVIEAKRLSRLSRRSLRRRHLHVLVQAGAYAVCVEETLRVPVTRLGFVDERGALLWVPHSPWIRRLVESMAKALHEIYASETPPPRKPGAHCHYCCYRQICWHDT